MTTICNGKYFLLGRFIKEFLLIVAILLSFLIGTCLLLVVKKMPFYILGWLHLIIPLLYIYLRVIKSGGVVRKYLIWGLFILIFLTTVIGLTNKDAIRRSFLASDSMTIRRASLIFIIVINDRGAKNILEEMLLSSSNDDFRALVVSAISALRLKDSKPVLLKCLKDSSSQVAGICAFSLVQLGENYGGDWLFNKIETDIINHKQSEFVFWVSMIRGLSTIEIVGKSFEIQLLTIKQWEKWWQENQNYLYWGNKENKFVIDQEAKAAGIPTEEYRKTHPWPTEEKK